MVDGLRYGMLGSSAFSPVVGGGILLALAFAATSPPPSGRGAG
jgi:hypothetical protein